MKCEAVNAARLRQVIGQLSPASTADKDDCRLRMWPLPADGGFQPGDNFSYCPELTEEQAGEHCLPRIPAGYRWQCWQCFIDIKQGQSGRVVMHCARGKSQSRQDTAASKYIISGEQIDGCCGSGIDHDDISVRPAQMPGGNRIEQSVDSGEFRVPHVKLQWNLAVAADDLWRV